MIKGKIDAALQKPTGLTKTKLVGVGAQGQENIEIGDNLTLANGKLSATGGGGSDINILNATFTDYYNGTFTGSLDINKINILIGKYFKDGNNQLRAFILEYVFTQQGQTIGRSYIVESDNVTLIGVIDDGQNKMFFGTPALSYYYHFITLTNNTSTFYFTYQNQAEQKLEILGDLKQALAGKRLLCNGHTDSYTAEYISGEGGNIVVGVVDNSDKSTSGITIDSSFTITDLVKPVE